MMLTRFKDWTKKPITWGGYLKFGGICMAISLAFTAVSYVIIFWSEISDWFENFKAKFKMKKHCEVYEEGEVY